MKKKIVAGMILFVMCISMCMTCFAASFSDLSEEHWAYENITKLVDEGVINGYPDGTYQPEKSVSKAEFIKLIMTSLFGADTFLYTGLEQLHWAMPYIVEADNRGYIINESILKHTNYDQPISRMEMAQILGKICEVNKINTEKINEKIPEFLDISELSKEDQGFIDIVAKNGFINGYPDGTFGSDRTMTRAECATIIYRFINRK